MGRHEVEAYLEKVFDWSALLARVPEGRQHPQHSTRKVFEAVFWGAMGRIPSFHQLEHECQAGHLRYRIGALSEDTCRYALERLAPAAVGTVAGEVARRLKRNGVMRTDATRSLVVAAIDGIELCSSYVRYCDACLERTMKRVIDGAEQELVQYYHRLVAVAVVSTPFPIPLGVRFLAPGESEVACGQALLEELVGRLGRRFVDVVVGDALYLQTPFIEALEGLGLGWVCTVKDNQPELVAEVARLTSGPPLLLAPEPSDRSRLWHLPEVYWAAADRTVRIVKVVRQEATTRVRVERVEGQRRTCKEVVEEESTNVYASSLPLLAVSPELLADLGRRRWRIDTEVFKTLTKECRFKHPAVHQQHAHAWVVLTMIRVLAYTLLLAYFHRQVLSHRQHRSPSLGQLASDVLQALSPPFNDDS